MLPQRAHRRRDRVPATAAATPECQKKSSRLHSARPADSGGDNRKLLNSSQMRAASLMFFAAAATAASEAAGRQRARRVKNCDRSSIYAMARSRNPATSLSKIVTGCTRPRALVPAVPLTSTVSDGRAAVRRRNAGQRSGLAGRMPPPRTTMDIGCASTATMRSGGRHGAAPCRPNRKMTMLSVAVHGSGSGGTSTGTSRISRIVPGTTGSEALSPGDVPLSLSDETGSPPAATPPPFPSTANHRHRLCCGVGLGRRAVGSAAARRSSRSFNAEERRQLRPAGRAPAA